jgi:hypothetical protein
MQGFLLGQPDSGGTTDYVFVPFYGRTRFCLRSEKMDPIVKIDLADIEPQRELIPLQEQSVGPVPISAGRPAADILAERAAAAVSGVPSPAFIP